MLEYVRIDVLAGIGVNKTNASKECGICHYWYFLDKYFKYEQYVCSGCHDSMQKAMNFNDVAIVFVKWSDCRLHVWYMSKYEATNIMKNSNLDQKSGLLYIFFLV